MLHVFILSTYPRADQMIGDGKYMGTTVKKAKNGYYAYVNYHDSSGNRRQKKAPGHFKLKREAKQAAVKLELELQRANPKLSEMTFSDYYQRWFDLYKKNKAKSHSASYQYALIGKYIKKYFKGTKLRDIKRSEYQAFINWYGANHSYESVRKLKGACHNCVGYAVDDGIVDKDFTNHVELAYNSSHTRKVEYLNNQELSKLKQWTVSKLDRYYTSRYMILTAIYTGLRKGEVQGLTWNDIDFVHSTISVNKQWDEKEKSFKPVKTKSSNRVIKVNRQLLRYLTDLKPNHTTMIFEDVFGKIPSSNAINKCLRNIMTQAGIKKTGFHFHSLRHTHVAYLIGQGVDIYAISKRLGHSNVNITLSVYAYLIDEYKTKNDNLIVEKLANI